MRRTYYGNSGGPRYREYVRSAPKYKCAGGCGNSVDRPLNTCLECTLDEIWPKIGIVVDGEFNDPEDLT